MSQVVDSDRKKENIETYLRASSADLLNANQWTDKFSKDIMIAAHTIMRFSLLDKLLDAMGFPVLEGLSEKERQAFPRMTGRMEDKVNNIT
jgi:hypothetical protein